jgi:hypothetical protein
VLCPAEGEYAVVEVAAVCSAGIGSRDRRPGKYFPLRDKPGGASVTFELRQIFVEDLIRVDQFIGELEAVLAARKPGDGPFP